MSGSFSLQVSLEMLHSIPIMQFRSIISHAWRHATTIIFVGGFFIDGFLLPSVDDPITKYLGLSYLVVLAILLPLREWVVSRNTASQMEQKLFSLLTFGIAFFSGAALSFIFIYALRSAAFAVSWPLFIILLLCMGANEFISTHNYRLTLDIAVYFISLVFYAIFNVPILFGQVTGFVFLVAIIISAAIGFLFMSILRKTSETAEYESPRGFALAFGIPMFVGMLYMLNVIPAVPLSLKDDGIYHNVVRTEAGEYMAEKEADIRYFAKYRRPTFHMTSGETVVYFFSSVGAPAEVSAPLTHVWEYYDETSKKWVTVTTINFDMTGGRARGSEHTQRKKIYSQECGE
jgi:hypothetical protein